MKKVLWIDDEIDKLRELQDVFEKNGFSVFFTSSISEGLKYVRSGTYENLLLDVSFYNNPDEGIDFLEQILELVPNLNIVIYTAYPNLKHEFRILSQYDHILYITKSNKHFQNEIEQKVFFQKLNNAFKGTKIKRNMTLKTIEVFVASSDKLSFEREKIEQLLARKNDDYITTGYYLKLNIWEKNTLSFSHSRKQSEFNELALKSDIFICLVNDQLGDFTKEELDVVYDNFIKSSVNKKILLFFKDLPIKPSEITEKFIAVLNLKKDIQSKGQFYSYYESIDSLLGKIDSEIKNFINTL